MNLSLHELYRELAYAISEHLDVWQSANTVLFRFFFTQLKHALRLLDADSLWVIFRLFRRALRLHFWSHADGTICWRGLYTTGLVLPRQQQEVIVWPLSPYSSVLFVGRQYCTELEQFFTKLARGVDPILLPRQRGLEAESLRALIAHLSRVAINAMGWLRKQRASASEKDRAGGEDWPDLLRPSGGFRYEDFVFPTALRSAESGEVRLDSFYLFHDFPALCVELRFVAACLYGEPRASVKPAPFRFVLDDLSPDDCLSLVHPLGPWGPLRALDLLPVPSFARRVLDERPVWRVPERTVDRRVVERGPEGSAQSNQRQHPPVARQPKNPPRQARVYMAAPQRQRYNNQKRQLYGARRR